MTFMRLENCHLLPCVRSYNVIFYFSDFDLDREPGVSCKKRAVLPNEVADKPRTTCAFAQIDPDLTDSTLTESQIL